MHANDNDPAKGFVSFVLSVAMLVAFFTFGPWLFRHHYLATGVGNAGEPPGLLSPSVSEQVRNGAKTWTAEEYLRQQIPDLIDDLTEGERRLLLNPSTTAAACDTVLSTGRQRQRDRKERRQP